MIKTRLLEMSALVAMAMIAGLLTNMLGHERLPLFAPVAESERSAIMDDRAFQLVDADFVQQMAASGQALILDARLPALYQQGHIPAAINCPIAAFSEYFPALRQQLQKNPIVIVYCSGPTCPDSRILARHLQESGVTGAMVYGGGMADWQEKHYAIAK